MSLFSLYLLTILDGLKGAAEFFMVFGLFVGFMMMGGAIIAKTSEEEDMFTLAYLWAKRLLLTGFIGMILFTATPTTKQAMLIAGGYYVTNIEDIEKLPEHTVKAVNAFLQEYTEAKGEQE